MNNILKLFFSFISIPSSHTKAKGLGGGGPRFELRNEKRLKNNSILLAHAH